MESRSTLSLKAGWLFPIGPRVHPAPSNGAHFPGSQGPGLVLSHPSAAAAEGVPVFVLSLSHPSPKQMKIKSGRGCVVQWSHAQASSGFSPSSATASA